MAVDRVERLLRAVAQALNDAGVDYAIIGGNAVAAWVATADDAAVRATRDVDVLIRRTDLGHVTTALRPIGLMPAEVMGVHMFVDSENPNPKTGVHIVFAGELVRPRYTYPAPDPSQRTLSEDGLSIIDLPQLLTMKLQAFRFIDRAHVQDMLDSGLIDERIRNAVPDDLRARLDEISTDDTE